jgi:hypothetical protein
MNNKNACRHWADRLSEAIKVTASLETKLREMGARDPTDVECDPLIRQAADVVIASDVPIKVDAGSIYDTLSEKEREALRQVYDIGDRVREGLFARAGVNWRNLRGKGRELRGRQIDTLMYLLFLSQIEPLIGRDCDDDLEKIPF